MSWGVGVLAYSLVEIPLDWESLPILVRLWQQGRDQGRNRPLVSGKVTHELILFLVNSFKGNKLKRPKHCLLVNRSFSVPLWEAVFVLFCFLIQIFLDLTQNLLNKNLLGYTPSISILNKHLVVLNHWNENTTLEDLTNLMCYLYKTSWWWTKENLRFRSRYCKWK